jgi:hypothetical protein
MQTLRTLRTFCFFYLIEGKLSTQYLIELDLWAAYLRYYNRNEPTLFTFVIAALDLFTFTEPKLRVIGRNATTNI